MIKIYCKYLKPIIAIILYFFITISSEAQFAQLREDIYMKDESSFSIGLLDLTTGKIKYKNEANKVKSVDSDQVLMVFNKVGEFIIFPTKEMNAHRADNFVKNATLPPSDLLITSDKKLIPAKIISKDN